MRRALLIPVLLASSPAVAQETEQEPAFEAPLQAWLASDGGDRRVLDDAVKALLDAERKGLERLAEVVRSAPADDRDRRRALDGLLTNVSLDFMKRQVDSGMIYAGQYDLLRVLQPHTGRFYTRLVLDTPDWFPEDMRAVVVPALRDLYPDGPDRDTLDLLQETAEDAEFESDSLRQALAFALAQWGRRDLVQGRIDELKKAAGDGRSSDELTFVRELAGFHYQMRDYGDAAEHWTRFLDGLAKLEDEPPANDLYNAACSLSLAGRIDDALAAIERCAGILARRGTSDSTVELSRSMFERDPDLRAIRSTKRFEKAVERAFARRDG